MIAGGKMIRFALAACKAGQRIQYITFLALKVIFVGCIFKLESISIKTHAR